jgi:MSHA biogenesis protein MshL
MIKITQDYRAIYLAILLILSWCACTPNLAQQDVNRTTAHSEKEERTPPIPPDLPLSAVLETESKKEKLFSFSGQDVMLCDVLDILSEQSECGVIWEKGIDRQIRLSVSFDGLILTEALDAVFAPTDYLYSLDGSILYVKLTDTWIFELGQIPFKISSTMSAGGDVLGSIPNAGGISGQFQITGSTDAEAADFWKQVETGLESVISPEGKYSINKLAGLVTVTDRKNHLKMARILVERLKLALARQVSIQAEVVEVTLEKDQSWGVDWSAVHSFLLDDEEVEATAEQTLGLTGSVVQFTASRHDATMMIDLLGRYGEVHVLSKPRVSVMNGQTAMINVGQVVSYWELTGISGGTEIGDAVLVPEQKTVLLGLAMGVTPYISSDGFVTLQVLPMLSDASTWSEFQFQDQTLRAPNIDIREASTLIRLKDGQTAVIGGLITSRKTDSENKIPLLGDLPLLGYLFKRKELVEKRAELVIFITPRITVFEQERG